MKLCPECKGSKENSNFVSYGPNGLGDVDGYSCVNPFHQLGSNETSREPNVERNRISNMEAKIESLVFDWLRSRGWEYICKTPGSYWMWQREWDAKTFLVHTCTARRIQEYWDGEAIGELTARKQKAAALAKEGK